MFQRVDQEGMTCLRLSGNSGIFEAEALKVCLLEALESPSKIRVLSEELDSGDASLLQILWAAKSWAAKKGRTFEVAHSAELERLANLAGLKLLDSADDRGANG